MEESCAGETLSYLRQRQTECRSMKKNRNMMFVAATNVSLVRSVSSRWTSRALEGPSSTDGRGGREVKMLANYKYYSCNDFASIIRGSSRKQ